MDTKNIVPAEELEQEQNALVEAKEEEIRESIISEFGFDEETDADRISKLVEKEMGHQKILSKTIGQKISWREKAIKPPEPKSDTKKPEMPDVNEIVNARLTEVLEQRDLEALEMPDELKEEIKRVAKIQGVSVKKAASDPYILARKEAIEGAVKQVEATASRTNKSGGKKVYDFNNPPDVDMATPEGRKEFDDWQDAMKKQGY